MQIFGKELDVIGRAFKMLGAKRTPDDFDTAPVLSAEQQRDFLIGKFREEVMPLIYELTGNKPDYMGIIDLDKGIEKALDIGLFPENRLRRPLPSLLAAEIRAIASPRSSGLIHIGVAIDTLSEAKIEVLKGALKGQLATLRDLKTAPQEKFIDMVEEVRGQKLSTMLGPEMVAAAVKENPRAAILELKEALQKADSGLKDYAKLELGSVVNGRDTAPPAHEV